MIRDINNNNTPISTYPTILLQCNSITDLQTNYLIGFGNTVSYVNKVVKVLDSTNLPNSVVGLSIYYTIIAGISGNTNSQLQFLQAGVFTAPLNIQLGGINSTSVLTNNKIMISNNNSITENTNTIIPNTLVISDNNGLPSSSLITSLKILNMLDKTGDTMTGNLLLTQNPISDQCIINKVYFDSMYPKTMNTLLTAYSYEPKITTWLANQWYNPEFDNFNTTITTNSPVVFNMTCDSNNNNNIVITFQNRILIQYLILSVFWGGLSYGGNTNTKFSILECSSELTTIATGNFGGYGQLITIPYNRVFIATNSLTISVYVMATAVPFHIDQFDITIAGITC